MKLFTRVQLHLLVAVLAVLIGWAVVFYTSMVNEITDEVDDSLEDYSELIIIRSLAGAELPSNQSGSNNQYFLNPVDRQYAVSREAICYRDSMIYIEEKNETEPARILTTLFKNEQGQYFELKVYTPTIEKKDLLQTLLYLLIALFVSLLIAIVLINIWVFRRSMRPFYRLLDWLNQFRIGQNHPAIDNPTQTTEFRKLNESVMRFAKHSESVYEQQKQFIGNASHEIQTPLAVCQNRLEMLMEDESLGETQMGEILKIYQTLVSVSKLNKSLLFLSKIENNQFKDIVEVSFNTSLHRYADDFCEVYAHKGLSVEFRENGIFKYPMNDALATVLITNLLKNAFVHNVDNGRICIETTSSGVSIGNSSTNGALDDSKIFMRFYQGTKKEGSTGLGLAIVDTICKQSQLKISYKYSDAMHWFVLSR